MVEARRVLEESVNDQWSSLLSATQTLQSSVCCGCGRDDGGEVKDGSERIMAEATDS